MAACMYLVKRSLHLCTYGCSLQMMVHIFSIKLKEVCTYDICMFFADDSPSGYHKCSFLIQPYPCTREYRSLLQSECFSTKFTLQAIIHESIYLPASGSMWYNNSILIAHQNSDFHFIYPSHNISCPDPQHDQGIGMIPAIMVSCYNYLPLMFDSFAMI